MPQSFPPTRENVDSPKKQSEFVIPQADGVGYFAVASLPSYSATGAALAEDESITFIHRYTYTDTSTS